MPTATVTDPVPTPDATLLRQMWLASPALPVGAFSYSEGLEAAADGGLVHDEASAARWLVDQLRLVQARAELAVAAAAWDAWQQGDAARAAALNSWVLATRETAEARLQAEQTGRSLADWLAQRTDWHAAAEACGRDPRIAVLRSLAPAPTWPVAFALAAVCGGIGRREALLAMAFGWAENMVQAAVKAVPLGQAAGQRVLAALAADIPAAVDAALAEHDATRQAFAPALAVLGARHETQYARLFRS